MAGFFLGGGPRRARGGRCGRGLRSLVERHLGAPNRQAAGKWEWFRGASGGRVRARAVHACPALHAGRHGRLGRERRVHRPAADEAPRERRVPGNVDGRGAVGVG